MGVIGGPRDGIAPPSSRRERPVLPHRGTAAPGITLRHRTKNTSPLSTCAFRGTSTTHTRSPAGMSPNLNKMLLQRRGSSPSSGLVLDLLGKFQHAPFGSSLLRRFQVKRGLWQPGPQPLRSGRLQRADGCPAWLPAHPTPPQSDQFLLPARPQVFHTAFPDLSPLGEFSVVVQRHEDGSSIPMLVFSLGSLRVHWLLQSLGMISPSCPLRRARVLR